MICRVFGIKSLSFNVFEKHECHLSRAVPIGGHKGREKPLKNAFLKIKCSWPCRSTSCKF